MKELTEKQRKVYDFIVAYVMKNGISPSLAEIGAHMGYRHPNQSNQHVTALLRKGYVTRSERLHRSIDVPALVYAERALLAVVRKAGFEGDPLKAPSWLSDRLGL